MSTFIAIFQRAVVTAISLLFGCTGEIVTEKSGNLNLGVPGVMCVGGISGFSGALMYEYFWGGAENPNAFLGILIPLIFCLLGSLLMGLIYSFLTTTLRANQNVTGLALTIMGVGLSNFLGGFLVKQVDPTAETANISVKVSTQYYTAKLPFASDLGWFGELFLNYGFLTYVGIVIAVLTALFIRRTRAGLNLRAVGENPATADAAGINVTKYKYMATCVGSMIAGLGGLNYVLNFSSGVWANDVIEPLGWTAIALVIFTVWKPNFAIPGAIIFGALTVLPEQMSKFVTLPMEAKPLLRMLPYLVTVTVLVFNSMRKKRETQPPESLGLPYFREDR